MSDNNGRGENGWNEWSKHVLSELSRVVEGTELLRRGFESFKVEIARDLAKKQDLDALREGISEQKNSHLQEISKVREDFSKKISDLDKDASSQISKIRQEYGQEIVALKSDLSQKAAVRGALAGGIPAIVVLIVMLISKMMG
jgi:UTP:GlnB (protein PII) uridylyltransferase